MFTGHRNKHACMLFLRIAHALKFIRGRDKHTNTLDLYESLPVGMFAKHKDIYADAPLLRSELPACACSTDSKANKQIFLFLYEFLRFTRRRHKYVSIYPFSNPRISVMLTKNRGKNASTLILFANPVRQTERQARK